MANALVIGMGGVGSVIARRFHEYNCFDRSVCADRDTVFAEKPAKRIPNNRFVVVKADAMDAKATATLMFSPETFFEELGATPYFVKNGRA